MNKKLQVFVSSIYTDLIEERQVAVQAILDAGHIPAGMELFKAGKSQMKTICKWIDESDVYMLILGGRYGSIEEDSGKSYTQLEYEYALSKKMPVFAIVLKDNFLFSKAASKGKNAVFESSNLDKYEDFKALVMSQVIKEVDNIVSIESIVHATLNDILGDDEYQLAGWVKGTTINNDPKILSRIQFLESKNKNLTSQITRPQNKVFGNFTASELISILSSINIFERILSLFDDEDINDDDDIKELQNMALYNANALDFFYAIFSFLALGIPNSLFNAQELDEEFMAIILSCASILTTFDLIILTDDNTIVITDIAKKFYAQLLLDNYTPTVNLLLSFIEMANL